VLRDNAANTAMCFRVAGVQGLRYFVHTVQLRIRDGLVSQSAVGNILGISRKMVDHFKHLSAASSRLKELQADLGLPQHLLI
jgi:hypothetical protein